MKLTSPEKPAANGRKSAATNGVKSRANGVKTRNGGQGIDHEAFMRQFLNTLGELSDGNFSSPLPSDWTGLEGRVADRFNQFAGRMENFNKSLLRLRRQ